MYKISKDFSFSCAHYLPDSPDLFSKKCTELHGHNYKVTVVVSRKVLLNGFVVDFGALKEAVNPIIEELDHKLLNKFILNPTAENIARYFYERIKIEILSSNGLEVIVSETDGNSASYTE